MILNYLIAIIDRSKINAMTMIFRNAGIEFSLTTYAEGTATRSHLSRYGLEVSDKAVITAVTGNEGANAIFKEARNKMYIDIPGNGIMITIPLKSVAGKKTLDFFSQNSRSEGNPNMEFEYELIVAVMNEGYSDLLMAAARTAGAGGGTVLHAKGTGSEMASKFFGMSIVNEKDIVYIVAHKDEKKKIMQAINEQAGPGTKAGAICFSLPISHVMGLRQPEEKND